jgi:response regulator of citrate/malate metabolism
VAEDIKVIIVEDDPMVAQINKRYLQKVSGLRLDGVFPNGKLAIAYLESNPVDLVVLDVYMPELDGLELLRRMRRQNLQTEVIMVTAANDSKQVDELLKLGVVDYLVKPFTEERFIEAMEKCRARIKMVSSGNELTQQAIDSMMGARSEKESETPDYLSLESTKSLNRKTMRLIMGALADIVGGYRTCEELATHVGLSRVTVRRYLNHLAEHDQLESFVKYDTGGRPSIKFKLK